MECESWFSSNSEIPWAEHCLEVRLEDAGFVCLSREYMSLLDSQSVPLLMHILAFAYLLKHDTIVLQNLMLKVFVTCYQTRTSVWAST